MKKIIGFIVAIGLLYLVVSPYITVYQMKSAAEAKNSEALSEYIDFPSVRKNLKEQISANFSKDISPEVKSSPFGAFGAAFGGVFVDKLLDAYITPQGITDMMNGEKPSLGILPNISNNDNEKPFNNASLSYVTPNRFSISVRGESSKDEMIFILSRQGLAWRLTEILL